MASSKGAILTDYLLVAGGAEKVALEAQQALDYPPLFAGCVNRDLFTKADERRDIEALGRYWDSGVIRGLETLLRFAALPAGQPRLKQPLPWALYAGSLAPLAALALPSGRNICYCHTPPRFMFDMREYYRDHSGVVRRCYLQALEAFLKPRLQRAVEKMDVVLANSNNVQQRIQRYWGIESEVVYPPIDTSGFRWLEQGDYYLSTARLEPYKQVDKVVRAFKSLPDKKTRPAERHGGFFVFRASRQSQWPEAGPGILPRFSTGRPDPESPAGN